MIAIDIDISKATFHAALDENVAKKFKNSPEGIGTFLEVLVSRNCTATETVIGLEATGVYHLLVCTRLRDAGFRVMIINPLESHQFIKSRSLRRLKTDTADAQALRSMLIFGKGRPFIETDDVLALKALVTERQSLVDIRTMMKLHREARRVRAHAISRAVYDPSPTVLAHIDNEIRMLEAQFVSFAPATQCLLRSIPGIGAISAATLVAHVSDIKRFPSPEKLVAYIGLDCRVHLSGTSVKGRGSISKRGNRQLRVTLFRAAFVARQINPDMQDYFARKLGEGKHYLSALTAVERKLVHLIYAVWSSGTPFVSSTRMLIEKDDAPVRVSSSFQSSQTLNRSGDSMV
jgi:transposase